MNITTRTLCGQVNVIFNVWLHLSQVDVPNELLKEHLKSKWPKWKKKQTVQKSIQSNIQFAGSCWSTPAPCCFEKVPEDEKFLAFTAWTPPPPPQHIDTESNASKQYLNVQETLQSHHKIYLNKRNKHWNITITFTITNLLWQLIFSLHFISLHSQRQLIERTQAALSLQFLFHTESSVKECRLLQQETNEQEYQ